MVQMMVFWYLDAKEERIRKRVKEEAESIMEVGSSRKMMGLLDNNSQAIFTLLVSPMEMERMRV